MKLAVWLPLLPMLAGATPLTYTVTGLSPTNNYIIGTTISGSVAGISSNGQVAATTHSTSNYEGFTWNGALTMLPTLGGANTWAAGINDSGDATGFSQIAGNSFYHAFYWNGSTMQDLGTLTGGGQSEGYAINSSGEIAGNSDSPYGNTQAFLWNGSSMQDLGGLGGPHDASQAGGINDAGDVTGDSCLDTQCSTIQAFIWNGSTMSSIGALTSGTGSYAKGTAINNSGEVAGYSASSGAGYHGFFWNGTSMTDMGTLGGSNSYALGINNLGDAVGYSQAVDGSNEAFYWNGTSMVNLNSMLAPGENWYIISANAINDAGDIVGYGIPATGGAVQVVLLTPGAATPEPGAAWLLAGGLILAWGAAKTRVRKSSGANR